MISWNEFQSTMPWKVALLVGGGFALAEGTEVSSVFMRPPKVPHVEQRDLVVNKASILKRCFILHKFSLKR